MHLRKLLLLLVFTLLTSCNGKLKSEPRVIVNDEFNWTITIPAGFEEVKASEWDDLQQTGEEAIEKTIDGNITNFGETIFVFRKGLHNVMEANHQPFDPNVDGPYEESHQVVQDIMYETFQQQIPDAIIDSSSTKTTISDHLFHTSIMKVTYPNGNVLNTISFSRLFHDRDFTINLMYLDEEIGKQMIKAWENSEFRYKPEWEYYDQSGELEPKSP